MQEHDDINLILGAAIEARGLTAEESSSLIKVIDELLKNSEYYMTREQHEENMHKVAERVEHYLEIIEAYRQRERQCSVEGCFTSQETEEVVLENLGVKVFFCPTHKTDGWHGGISRTIG